LASYTVSMLFVGLCILNIIYLWKEWKNLDIWEKVINSALIWLVAGIPLLFSSLTRSVFEVWKLLLLRLVIITVFLTWITKRILISSKDDNGPDTFSFFGIISWKKTGLEIPFIVWGIINILSTIFSQNIYVAIIGAYDRWEGVITVFNYIFLFFMISKMVKTTSLLNWMLIIVFGSTALSAVYSIFQSLGMDFMRWSADPTQRTFACINNPVHYSAYIAMVVPLGMGWLLSFSSKDHGDLFVGLLEIKKFIILFAIESIILLIGLYYNLAWLIIASLFFVLIFMIINGFLIYEARKYYFLKLYTFISLLIIYYSMYISYGRGTWMGFSFAMLLYFLFLTGVINIKNRKEAIIDFFISFPVIGLFFLNFVFNLYKLGPKFVIPSFVIFALYFFYIFFKQKKWNMLLLRLIIIVLFIKLPFVATSIANMILYFSLIFLFYFILFHTDYDFNINLERKRFILSFLVIFGLTLTLPMLPNHLKTIFDNKEKHISSTGANIMGKASRLESEALNLNKGNPRISMWKSSLGWAGVPYPYFQEKDGKFNWFLHSTAWINGIDFEEEIKGYPVLGTGPDTVKEFYPVYRRPDYGRMEGGHNLTPDRVHNEYFNMLITTGFSGFIVNYLWIMVAYVLIIIKALKKYYNTPYFFIILGAFTGALIYEGQVFFNFGVVATKFLFYFLMGLTIAINTHDIGLLKEKEAQNNEK